MEVSSQLHASLFDTVRQWIIPYSMLKRFQTLLPYSLR
jgi:hypothetical protein